MKKFTSLAVLLLAFAYLGLSARSTLAANNFCPILQITEINKDNFPIVTLHTIAQDKNHNPISIRDIETLEITEDGKLVTSPDEDEYSYEQFISGIEMLFVLDIGVGIENQNFSTGRSRIEDIHSIVQFFLENATPSDRVGVILLRENTPEYVIPITNDLARVTEDLVVAVNAIRTSPPERDEYTQGMEGVREGLKQLASSTARGHMVQTMIFITAGIQIAGFSPETIGKNALEQGVSIHTIDISGTIGEEDVLHALSENSGGYWTSYQGEASLGNLKTWTNDQHLQYLFQFRSQSNSSSERVLELKFAGSENTCEGQSVQSSMIYQVELEKPIVVVDAPTANEVITRNGKPGEFPDSVEPTLLDVKAHVEWPDGYIRGVQSAQLWVNGEPTGPQIPYPGNPLTFGLDLKPYSSGTSGVKIQVKIQDELGFESFSTDTNISVVYFEMPSPTPTTSLAEIDLPSQELEKCTQPSGLQKLVCQTNDVVGWFGLILGGVSLVLVLTFRRPIARVGGAAVKGIRETIIRLTRPAQTEIGAYLEVLRGETDYQGREIPIYIQTVTPIGRSPEEAEIVFHANNEQSVISRLHCEISDDNGVYRVRDMGSSHGTFVNGVQLPEGGQGQKLRDGDRIELGQSARGGVMVQFKLADEFKVSDEKIFDTSPTPYEPGDGE